MGEGNLYSNRKHENLNIRLEEENLEAEDKKKQVLIIQICTMNGSTGFKISHTKGPN